MAENITEIEQVENQNSNNIENTVVDETNVQSDNVITNKIIKWKEKLIDLTRRNRLLNFKSPKNASIKIIDEIPTELFRILVANSKQMKFLPIKDNTEDTPEEQRLSREALNEGIEFKAQEFEKYEREALASKHVDNYLQTNLPEKDLTRTLRKISTAAKTAMDDLGYNTLFLTLGSVVWYESDYSDVKYESPLILLPIRLVRANMNDAFRAEYNDDDIILNPALVLQLKKEFHISLDDLVTNEIDDTNILKIFETVQERISIKKRWKLYNNSYIGLFSFAKFVMYKDLEEHTDIVKKSSLVKSICGFGEWQETNIEKVCPVKELDKNFLPKDNFSILDADSSQQQAIAFVKENNNLVIQGPPGTGKSQTIANIIAELLSQGKKVLFVSQKIAALEVVQNRLEANGLAPYCLELHSNKTNRRTVLQNLVNSLAEPEISNHTGTSLDILQQKKIELNEYVKAVHHPIGNLNISPFDAIGIVCSSDIPDLEYIFDDYEKWDKTTLEYKKGIFTTLKNIVEILGNPKQYSWYGSHIKNLDSDYQNKIIVREKLKNISESLKFLKVSYSNLCKNICIREPNIFKDIEQVLEIANIVLNIPQNTFKNVSFADEKLSNDINKICECIKQFNIYNNRVKNNYSLGILNEDLEFQIELFSNFSKGFFSKFSIDYLKRKGHIKKFFINGYKASALQIYEDLRNLKELKHWIAEINNSNDIAENIFNELWNKEQSSEDSINQSSQSIIKLKKLLNSNIFTTDIITKFKEQGINKNEISNLCAEINDLHNKIISTFEELSKLIILDIKEAFNAEYESIGIKAFEHKINSMLSDIEDLTLWNQYLNAIDNIEKENLTGFYNKFLNSNIDFNKIDKAFEVQFLRIWLNCYVYAKSNVLREFNTAQHNNLIKQFKELDTNLIKSAKLRLCQILHDNMINGKNNFPKELADLEHESKLQRLRKSLRQIINMIPNLLLSIKPCLMMSPLTVSQLLDPAQFNFDYIIFDEASQLTTEDCIGSMIRGKRLIVAGDEQQLPPTSFFKSVTEPSEDDYSDDDEKEDLESILVECQTSSFPKCMLKWHYRSKDEHLIAFSNKHLYRELYTFPSSVEVSDITGIKWHYYENTEHNEKNALQAEARMVAKAAIEHAKCFPTRTLAVATFNVNQKSLIEDEINELLKTEKDCMDFFDDKKTEPFFVKNLESVQGDERDVIFISMGTFKNQNGVLDMRSFGPINRDGGERRLNVLITRARYKLEIFSAIRYGDFKDEKLKTEGVKLLKQYLEYAERGEVALFADTKTELDDKFDSPFEEAVCRGLRKAGYTVKTQVGCSGYRIDMAIRDEKNPGEFLLGIECDGRTYHSSATARDRDRLREEVLRKLEWKIYRIWSTDWFKNPQRELDRLIKYIEDLKISKELNK